MARNIDYFYKGYDITNKNKMERVLMEWQNPYGYNFDTNNRRVIDYNFLATRTNQNMIKNKEFNDKKL